MEKIYYNQDGWVCNRYPHDIPIDDENRFIEVDDEIAQDTYGCRNGYAWRVLNGKLIEDIYDRDKVNISELESELGDLTQWFEEIYDMQAKQYERCVRLGIAYDSKYGSMFDLDREAVLKGKRITEIRKMLQN